MYLCSSIQLKYVVVKHCKKQAENTQNKEISKLNIWKKLIHAEKNRVTFLLRQACCVITVRVQVTDGQRVSSLITIGEYLSFLLKRFLFAIQIPS